MTTIFKLPDDSGKITTLLQSYFQSGNLNFLIGSGASMPAIPTAGTIEAEIDNLLENGNVAQADLAALDFIEALTLKHSSLGSNEIAEQIATTLAQYTNFLQHVDRILFERKSVLLPRQANIFTSNYDTFMEHAAGSIPTLILNDGFRRSGVVDGRFELAPECYFDRTYRSASIYSQSSEIPTINLMKFHGSLSWVSEDNKIVFRDVLPKPLPAADRGNSESVQQKLSEYFLVLPNLKKFDAALMQRVYYDLLRLFANAMERENAVLVCFGFSFQDEHILDIAKRSLRNPTAQLIIVAFNAAAVELFQSKFAQHRNVTILAPVGDQTIGFGKFNSLIEAVLPSQLCNFPA